MATRLLEQQADKEYKEALKRQKEAAEESQVINRLEQTTLNEPQHEISNNVVCATSKASDQLVA